MNIFEWIRILATFSIRSLSRSGTGLHEKAPFEGQCATRHPNYLLWSKLFHLVSISGVKTSSTCFIFPWSGRMKKAFAFPL